MFARLGKAIDTFFHGTSPERIEFSQPLIQLVFGKRKNIGRVSNTVLEELTDPVSNRQAGGFQNDKQIHVAARAEIASRKRTK